MWTLVCYYIFSFFNHFLLSYFHFIPSYCLFSSWSSDCFLSLSRELCLSEIIIFGGFLCFGSLIWPPLSCMEQWFFSRLCYVFPVCLSQNKEKSPRPGVCSEPTLSIHLGVDFRPKVSKQVENESFPSNSQSGFHFDVVLLAWKKNLLPSLPAFLRLRMNKHLEYSGLS